MPKHQILYKIFNSIFVYPVLYFVFTITFLYPVAQGRIKSIVYFWLQIQQLFKLSTYRCLPILAAFQLMFKHILTNWFYARIYQSMIKC